MAVWTKFEFGRKLKRCDEDAITNRDRNDPSKIQNQNERQTIVRERGVGV